MIPTVTVPANVQLPQAPQVAAVQALPNSDTAVATQLTFQAVAANSSPVALFNNLKNNQDIRRQNEESGKNETEKEPKNTKNSAKIPVSGFSSSFLTQLVGQNGPDNGKFFREIEEYVPPVPEKPREQTLLEQLQATPTMAPQARAPLPFTKPDVREQMRAIVNNDASLVRPRGLAGYVSAITRNIAHLVTPTHAPVSIIL